MSESIKSTVKLSESAGSLEPEKITRRSLIASATVLPAGALASHEPSTSKPADTATPGTLPEWWEEVATPGAMGDPEFCPPWEDTPLSREIAIKIDELHKLFLEGAPEGTHTLQDFRLNWIDGVPHNLFVIARAGKHGARLYVFRPEFGWLDRTPQMVEYPDHVRQKLQK